MSNNFTTSNNFKKTFFKNVLISGGYNYLSQGLTFISSIILARLLSPSNYGFVGLITVFTGFISVFSDSGISLAVIKSDYKFIYHKSLDTLAFYMGCVLFIMTCLLAYPLTLFYKDNSLLVPTIALSSTFVFRSMGIVRSALISKRLDFNYIGKVVLINNVIMIILTVNLALLGAQHWSIILPQVISSIVTVCMYEYKVRLGFSLYKFKYVKVAYNYTKRTIGSLIGFNMVNYWARNSDNLIVGKLYGINELGIYNRAYSLLTLPLTLVSGLMGTVLYPTLKKLKSNGGDVFPEYLYVLRIIEIIVFPISCIFILIPNQLVLLLWGYKWSSVGTLLPYFGLLVFSQPLLATAGNILVLQGKERIMMFSGWIGAFFIISGIIIGSYISLLAIAQYYSLAYIFFILPFNMHYIYCYGLGFDKRAIYKFWIPVIVISLGLWISCFYNIEALKIVFLMALLLNITISSINDIKKVIKKLKVKFVM